MQAESVVDGGILANKNHIVVVDELGEERLAENGPHGQGQENANSEGRPTIGRLNLRRGWVGGLAGHGTGTRRNPAVTGQF